MLFVKRKEAPGLLRPFVLKIRDGFLVGLMPDSSHSSPCANCVQLWLQDRHVWFEPSSPSHMTVRKDILVDLMATNEGHTFFEIHNDGTSTQLDCIVYPHDSCGCNRESYRPPERISKKTNFAFSPLHQIKCARYGTPEGNLWLAAATGNSHISHKSLTMFGAAPDRESARFRAVDEWLKKIATEELKHRLQLGESIVTRQLQNDTLKPFSGPLSLDAIGSGQSYEEALLDGLERWSLVSTLKKYASRAKNPMLIVGANNWIRGKVPFFMLQQYDLHILFYPNSTQTWVAGIVALSRVRTEEPPLFAFASGANVRSALDRSIGNILIHCRPTEWYPMKRESNKPTAASKLHLWWTNWVYRCPKISLRDILHLEEYPRDLKQWTAYFRDGLDPLSLISINSPLLPSGIRHLVALQMNSSQAEKHTNLNGIGIWSNVSDLLHV